MRAIAHLVAPNDATGSPLGNPRPTADLVADNGRMDEVEIRDGSIRLGQLLKLAGLAEHGAEAKALLEAGEVLVNETVEIRRGRQLAPGDQVALGEEVVQVTRAQVT